jgi:hypothetical protein
LAQNTNNRIIEFNKGRGRSGQITQASFRDGQSEIDRKVIEPFFISGAADGLLKVKSSLEAGAGPMREQLPGVQPGAYCLSGF